MSAATTLTCPGHRPVGFARDEPADKCRISATREPRIHEAAVAVRAAIENVERARLETE